MADENTQTTLEERKNTDDNRVIAGSEEALQSHGSQERIAALEASLAEKEAALNEASKSLNVQTAECASFKSGYDEAVKAYRKLAVGSNPLFTEELITGSTVAEIDASLIRAADFVGKVRSRIEEDLKALSVPAGAPERSAPDTSGYSPREKIAEGIKKQNK